MQSPFNYGGAPIADRVSLALPPPSSARAERLFFQPKFKQPAPNSPGLTRLGERGFQIPSTILEFPELGKNRRIVQESEARPIFYTGPGAGCLGEEPPRDWGPARSGAADHSREIKEKKEKDKFELFFKDNSKEILTVIQNVNGREFVWENL